VGAAWQAPAAFGADSIYWATGNTIRVGPLDGGGPASSLFSGESGSIGIAIDARAGKIYWADETSGAIRVANLDGTGLPSNLYMGESAPLGVAIDPAAGKIYWSSASNSGSIRVGSLDGNGSPQSLYTSEGNPRGIAIDPAAGKIYWANFGAAGPIRVGDLNGSGPAVSLYTTGEVYPEGVAIDPAAGKLYWGDESSGAIRVGVPDGSAPAQNLFTGESNPFGVALDPIVGKIYWATVVPGAIRSGSLSGGSASSSFTGESTPYFPALLRSPVGTGTPQVSGASTAGSMLSCSQGSWAPDLLGAFLYRAPRSFAYRWTFNGADIIGATSNSYTAPASGTYACRVTATNQAGSTSQTSASFIVTGGGTPPPTTLALANVSQAHRRWRESGGLPHIASARPPVGTTFRFTLNESARVRFVFKQRLAGRLVGGRCVAVSAMNRSKPKCTRLVGRGSLSFSVNPGAHTLRFQGRISKHKRLPIGRYTVAITATNSAGQRETAKLTFTIVKG
jgi:DNA-binding beta-propeller fold protein YncE